MRGPGTSDMIRLAALRLADPTRLAAVRASGLMELPPEPTFDRIASIAQRLLNAPYAFVTIVDDTRAGWLSSTGTEVSDASERVIPVGESLAQYVIALDRPFMVDDARSDERTSMSPSIDTIGVTAWAGAPLRDEAGNVLGAVCVADVEPRRWTDADTTALSDLAQVATDRIVASKSARSAANSEAVLAAVLARAPIGFALVDTDFRYEMVNETLAAMNGVSVADHLGRTMRDVIPDVAESIMSWVRRVFDTGEAASGIEVVGVTPAYPGVERTWLGSYYLLDLADGPRAGVFIEDITERATARKRALQLATITEALARAESLDAIEEVVTTQVTRFFGAPIAIVSLWDPGAGAAKVFANNAVRKALDETTFSLDDDAPYALAARSHEIVTVSDRADRAARFTSEVGAKLVAEAVVPCITSDGSLVGLMTIGWHHRIEPGEFPIPQFRTLAGLIAGVVERTRLQRHRNALIEELQDTLLSPPPIRPKLDTAVRYQPAEDATGLGGDWFDVVAIDDDRTGLVVGDVVGHGPSAAARMSQIGSTIAQLLLLDTPLERVFTAAERVLAARSIDTMATVAIVVVDTANRTLTSVSAGHLPAIMIDPSGEVSVVAPALRPPLSTFDRAIEPTSVPYESGTKLMLFTDGLIETKDGDLDTDVARVLAHTRTISGLPIDDLLDRLLADLTRERNQFDDLAALAVLLH